MSHPDADDLALLALGESVGPEVDDHVAGCADCTAEVVAFRETAELVELSNFGEHADRPGEHVWQAIAAELGFDDRQRTVATGSGGSVAEVQASEPPAPDTASLSPVGAPNGGGHGGPGVDGRVGAEPPRLRVVPTPTDLSGAATAPQADTSGASVSGAGAGAGVAEAGTGAADRSGPVAGRASSSPASRRWPRWAAPLAAAVAGIAVGAGAVVITQNVADDARIEAVAALTPVPDGPLTGDQQLGKAELVDVASGQRVRVDVADLPPSSNAYEVWLIGDDGRMVALGTLSDGSGSFAVPAGISTQEYHIVDVSEEPPDGIPTHSGVSLVRGSF